MRIFLLFLVFVFSKSYGAGIVDHDQTELTIYADATVTVKKVTNIPEMATMVGTVFATAMAEGHLMHLHYCLESPFGVYVAYESASSAPVAIQSFHHGEENGCLVAYPATNVLDAHQGKRYGTILRKVTAKYFDNFFGQQVKIDGKELSHLPLSHLTSGNEWCFGDNHPSLKSALNAGYGIEYIFYGGNLAMRYPATKDGTLWSEDRVAALVEFSKVMMNPSSASSPSIMGATMEHMRTILSDLDYTKEDDITTLLSVAERVIKITNPDEGPDRIALETRPIYQEIYEGPLREVFTSLNETQKQSIKTFVEKGRELFFHNFNGVLKHAESMSWISALT